ncbi:TRAP transporter small permease subunit [Pelagibacterium sp. H642]|uniref:TRAP transporter small permease n=1 Tax=Pelagibacterium sp. H642 TaxID=1881069 RepID=UPI002815131F|nr:TRAP transporter small permease subunit [Pelagibacterium sp. H642]WMT91880.1 TRAP transporter small permease subunit [Pelagibacterium sp. H642]
MRPAWPDAQAWPTKGDTPFVVILKSAIAVLDYSGRIIGIASLTTMFVALLVNVVLRYAFGSGLAWAYEIHLLLLPWLVGAGVVVASAQGSQIAITLLYDLIGPRLGRWLLLFIQIAMVAISISILWTSSPILRAAGFQRLSTLGITQVWGYASLIYAFAGMGLIAFLDAVRLLVQRPIVPSA